MSAREKKMKGSEVISTELTAGLLLITVFRIIQRNVFSPEGQFPTHALSGLTRSFVCVWFASNVKFMLFKSNSPPSLFAHSISRLVAFLALLGACCERCTVRGQQEQLAALDILLLSYCVASSLIVMALGHSHLKGSLKQLAVFTKPQRFFQQMDSFASLLFGVLWLLCPYWLLGPGMTGSEETLQLHLTQAFGAMMVGDSFVSSTLQSQSDTSRTSVFSRRTVGTVMLLMFVLCNQLTASAWAGTHVLFGLVAAGLWTGNSILGYLSSKEAHTGLSVEEIYKLALWRKERVQVSHQGATQRRTQRL